MRQIPSLFKIEWHSKYSVIIHTVDVESGGKNWMNVHMAQGPIMIRNPGTSNNALLPHCWEIA